MHPKILVSPDLLSQAATDALTVAGFDLHPVTHDGHETCPSEGWAAAILHIPTDNDGQSWEICRTLRRPDSDLQGPIIVVIQPDQFHKLASPNNELFDDFVVAGFKPAELSARVSHRLHSKFGSQTPPPEMVGFGPIKINVKTYQASVDNKPLDLTYMEYQLLLFLTTSPGQVFSREVLLNQVWGYEYYGGARTVDVHIRRLRAKLGDENAQLIMTVRSVGYKLGQTAAPTRPTSTIDDGLA